MNIHVKDGIVLFMALVLLHLMSTLLSAEEYQFNFIQTNHIKIEKNEFKKAEKYDVILNGEKGKTYYVGDRQPFFGKHESIDIEAVEPRFTNNSQFTEKVHLLITVKRDITSQQVIYFKLRDAVDKKTIGDYEIILSVVTPNSISPVTVTANSARQPIDVVSGKFLPMNASERTLKILAFLIGVLLIGVGIIIGIMVWALVTFRRNVNTEAKDNNWLSKAIIIEEYYKEKMAGIDHNISSIATVAEDINEQKLVKINNSLQEIMNKNADAVTLARVAELLRNVKNDIGEGVSSINTANSDIKILLEQLFQQFQTIIRTNSTDMQKIIDCLSSSIRTLKGSVETGSLSAAEVQGIKTAFQNAVKEFQSAVAEYNNTLTAQSLQKDSFYMNGKEQLTQLNITLSTTKDSFVQLNTTLNDNTGLLRQQFAQLANIAKQFGDKDDSTGILGELKHFDASLKESVSGMQVLISKNPLQNVRETDSTGVNLAGMNRFFNDIETEINRLSIAEIFDVSDVQLLIKGQGKKLNIASNLSKDLEDIIEKANNPSLLRNVNLHTAELNKRHMALQDIDREMREIINSFDKGSESTAFGKLLSLIRGNKKINALKLKCEDALKDTETEKIAMIIRNIGALIDDEIYVRTLNSDAISKANETLTTLFEIVALKPINPRASDMLNLYEHDVIAEENVSGVARGYVAKTKRRGFYLNNTVRWKAEVVVAK